MEMRRSIDLKTLFAGGLIVLCVSIPFGCTRPMPTTSIIEPGTYDRTIEVRPSESRRNYRVHVPPRYSTDTPLPLVVVIHGAFDTAKGMEKVSGFSDLADREGFLVLYPNGIGLFGFFQHWNAGHCCGKAAREKLDDVGFIVAAIEDVCGQFSVDKSRIYMTGFSNGGMMTYRFAAEKGDLLAAAAPLAASIGGRPSPEDQEWRIPEPVSTLPILTMHGLDDDTIPFDGSDTNESSGGRTYVSVADSIDFWVSANGCKVPIVTDVYEGRIRLTLWEDCARGSKVAIYAIQEWGHVWPGPYFTSQLPEGDPLKAFDAAEIIWAFFKEFHKP